MVWGVLTCRNQGVMLSNFRDYAHWTIICKRNVNIDHWRRKTKVLKLCYFNNLEFFSKMPCSYDQGIEDFCAECKICTDRQTDRQTSESVFSNFTSSIPFRVCCFDELWLWPLSGWSYLFSYNFFFLHIRWHHDIFAGLQQDTVICLKGADCSKDQQIFCWTLLSARRGSHENSKTKNSKRNILTAVSGTDV